MSGGTDENVGETVKLNVEVPEERLEEIGELAGELNDTNRPEFVREGLRVGDFRVLIDWDRDDEIRYAIGTFERKKEYRELGKYREVWGSWRDGG